MFLDSLQDAGIDVYGDGSKASTSVQSVAQSVVALLPRMGSPMRVFLNEGAIQLVWNKGARHLSIAINGARRVSVKVNDGEITRTHYCAGESSALGACLQRGLDLYLKKTTTNRL